MTGDLHEHYRLLLGLVPPWTVVNVDLNMAAKRVDIDVEWPANHQVECPVCQKHCFIKDHREERKWRHLDTMQFQTIIKSRVPRADCPEHGAKTINVPWAGPNSRFTLLFERLAIDVMIAAKSIKEAARLLGLSWDQVHHIQERAVERGIGRRDLDEVKHCRHRFQTRPRSPNHRRHMPVEVTDLYAYQNGFFSLANLLMP